MPCLLMRMSRAEPPRLHHGQKEQPKTGAGRGSLSPPQLRRKDFTVKWNRMRTTHARAESLLESRQNGARLQQSPAESARGMYLRLHFERLQDSCSCRHQNQNQFTIKMGESAVLEYTCTNLQEPPPTRLPCQSKTRHPLLRPPTIARKTPPPLNPLSTHSLPPALERCPRTTTCSRRGH